jgi:signal transduction histidine kinase
MADNTYRLFLDGREIGRGSDWRIMTEYDLTLLLRPGTHVLGVLAFNDFFIAGVVLGLRVRLADGRVIEIGSDENWRVVPPDVGAGWVERARAPASWPDATVLGAYGTGYWGTKFKVERFPLLRPPSISFWRTGWFQLTLACLCVVFLGACLYLAGKLMMQTQSQQVVQRERARIARDLHDNLSAELTRLVLLGETTQSELPSESGIRQHLSQICERTRGLLRAMNETIWVVNSQRDTLRDFASYVCKYAETFLQSTPMRCRFDVEPDLPATPCDVGVRRNLFLAVKEALNNALRHSGASEVFVRIHREGPGVVVCIEDDGRGFDPASADRERNGLQNMIQRAAEAGGACSVTSIPGAGCRVQFKVPLAGPRRHPLNWFARRKERPPFPASHPLTTPSSKTAHSKDSSS